jgi:hypothetical protein
MLRDDFDPYAKFYGVGGEEFGVLTDQFSVVERKKKSKKASKKGHSKSQLFSYEYLTKT